MRKIALLSALYFAQGLPFGFQAVALSAYFRQAGASLEGIGFLGLLSAPWALKLLWAPWVDRYYSPRLGRRRSWIIPAQAGLVATCTAAAFVPVSNTVPLLVLVFLMNLFAATQDIAVDGLAVDLLSERELGPGNAAQVVGYKIGMLAGGGLLVWASRWIGWQGLFGGMALAIGLVLVAVLAWREPAAESHLAAEPTPIRRIVGRLIETLTAPGARWLVIFVLTYKLGETLVDVMFKPFLVDAGYTPDQLGLWVGTWGMTSSIAGSLAGGWLALRWRLWPALALTAALRVLPMVGEWWLAWSGQPTPDAIIAVTCAEHLFGGMLTTCTFAFMMSCVDRRIGASHFTALASLEVIGKSIPGLLSGVLAGAVGYAWTFGIGAILAVALLPVLVPLRKAAN